MSLALSFPLWPAAVCVALLLDARLGEPAPRWHPVVWMGRYLGWAGARAAPRATQAPVGRDFKAFWQGVRMWWFSAAIVLIVSVGLQWGLSHMPEVLGALALGVLLKPLLAWRMLHREVEAVEAALGTSLDAGRQRLAWLVSRDVTPLDAVQVRESAIESLAENLNDSVVAPLFWFALAGLPGAALYRLANTADAMWGYRGERAGRVWEWAGKWAAWADDALSWLPARLTALLLVAVGGLRWRTLGREAARTPSPNSGWPMAAMALALGVHLGKRGVYALNAAGRPAGPADTAQAIRLGQKVVQVLVAGSFLALLFKVLGAP